MPHLLHSKKILLLCLSLLHHHLLDMELCHLSAKWSDRL